MPSRLMPARRALYECRALAVPLTTVHTLPGTHADTYSEGELVDLIDEFSDGRIQFAFLKIKDQNTTLPKTVLIAWVRI